jgi:CRP/FNR family transcriptional regulator, cyclic AMP receptor protein
MRSPYGMEVSEKCQVCALRTDGFFCNFSAGALKTLETIKFTTVYPEGAILFVEEEAPRGVYLLCKGRVKLSMTASDGKTLILRIVKAGDVLGLNATVSGQPYAATAETLEPCQVNFLRREDFLAFLRTHPEAALAAARQMSSSYQAACQQIRSLGLTHSAPEKLARFLLQWSTRGQATKQGIRVPLTLTHEEISQIIGTSRETVTRTLGQFRNNQWAVVRGSSLVIQDKAALEHFAAA